ncbi:MAG TPA: phosphatase PAP2 family protein [Acetobacteraceae bacterium]|nr:phosphatase PAP2 family protein [Acetobacteraceae bacterium]
MSTPGSRRARLNAALAGLGERLERRTGLLLLGLAALLWGFLALAGRVMEGDTEALDRALLLMLRAPGNPAEPLGPRWVQEMGRDITALGGIAVLTLVTLAAAAFLALRRLWSAAALLAFSVAGGMLVSTLLKEAYERPRPDLVPHAAYVMTSSFPSGHSMMSAVVYLTLGALLARVEPGRRVKVFLLGLATVLTVLVGVSRVYLGVHWPTDVAAGWTLGAAWASLCWLLARALQRRGQVGVDRGG